MCCYLCNYRVQLCSLHFCSSKPCSSAISFRHRGDKEPWTVFCCSQNNSNTVEVHLAAHRAAQASDMFVFPHTHCEAANYFHHNKGV